MINANRIIGVAENLSAILKYDYVVCCPGCGERYFAAFDKLYTSAYGKGVCCSTEEEIDAGSDNIFALL